jgi:hypothetical protein
MITSAASVKEILVSLKASRGNDVAILPCLRQCPLAIVICLDVSTTSEINLCYIDSREIQRRFDEKRQSCANSDTPKLLYTNMFPFLPVVGAIE